MKFFKSTLTSLLLFSLTACNDHQPAKPPTKNLGASGQLGSASSASDQNTNASLFVSEREYGDSGVTIALDAKITNISNATDINWSQISGPVATIINADQLSASVILPFVETPTTMEFEITVSHGTQTLSAIQSVTILPLPAKVAVDNPVLSIEDQFIRATLLTPIEPNTGFALSIVGGTAIEGIDFAPLPATVTAVDGASLNIPIAILPNDRTQDVYAKLALQAPNQEIITFIFVAPAETAGGTQAPSSAISTSSNMASSSATSETSTSSDSGSASSQNSDLTKNYETREAYRIAEWYSFNSLDLTLDNIADAIDSGNLDQLKSDFKETYIYDELGRLDEYLIQSQSQRTQGTYSYNEVDTYLISSISEIDEIAQIGDTDTPQKILSSTEFSFNDDSVSITSFSDDINYRSEIFLELNQNELVTTKHYSPESQASHASTDIFEWERDTLLSWYRQDFEGNVYEAYTYSYLGDFATGADYEFTSDTGEITSETEIYHYYSHNNRIYFITETSSDGEPTLYDVKVYDYLTCHESEWRKIKFGWDLPNYPSCLDSSVLDLATEIDTSQSPQTPSSVLPRSSSSSVIQSFSSAESSSIATDNNSSSISVSVSSSVQSSLSSSEATPIDIYATRGGYRVTEELLLNRGISTVEEVLQAIQSNTLHELSKQYFTTYIYDELGRLTDTSLQSESQQTFENYIYLSSTEHLIESYAHVSYIDNRTINDFSYRFQRGEGIINVSEIDNSTGSVVDNKRIILDDELIDEVIYTETMMTSSRYDWDNNRLLGWQVYRDGIVDEQESYDYQDGFISSVEIILGGDETHTENYYYYHHNDYIYVISKYIIPNELPSINVKKYELARCHQSEWVKPTYLWSELDTMTCLDKSVKNIASEIDATIAESPNSSSSASEIQTDKYQTRQAYRISKTVTVEGDNLSLEGIRSVISNNSLHTLQQTSNELFLFDSIGRLFKYDSKYTFGETVRTFGYELDRDYMLSSINHLENYDPSQEVTKIRENFNYYDNSIIRVTTDPDTSEATSRAIIRLQPDGKVFSFKFEAILLDNPTIFEAIETDMTALIYEKTYTWDDGTLNGFIESFYNGGSIITEEYFYLNGLINKATYSRGSEQHTENYSYLSHNDKLYIISGPLLSQGSQYFSIAIYEYAKCHKSAWTSSNFGWDLPTRLTCLDREVFDLAQSVVE